MNWPELWVWVTLGAAAAQTIRFMLQKQLRTTTLSTAGATFARFVYSAPQATGPWHRRIFNRAVALGLGSGVFFALSAVGYRGASLSLAEGDAFFLAATTLACVTAFQTTVMTLWLRWHTPGQITAVIAAWRVASLVGLTSMAGSLCWFTAFTLQTVALVNGVGQIELVFSLLIGALVFKERITAKEYAGITLLMISIVTLITKT